MKTIKGTGVIWSHDGTQHAAGVVPAFAPRATEDVIVTKVWHNYAKTITVNVIPYGRSRRYPKPGTIVTLATRKGRKGIKVDYYVVGVSKKITLGRKRVLTLDLEPVEDGNA